VDKPVASRPSEERVRKERREVEVVFCMTLSHSAVLMPPRANLGAI
jgi:hypothetical protein